MTPAVPTVNSACPWFTTPAPIAAHCWSPAPRQIGMPAGSPVSAAAVADSVPACPDGMPTGGTRSRSMPHSARMRSLQSSLPISIMPFSVSDAGSVTHSSAPMRCRKYSWPLANQRVREKTSRSLSRSHAIFAADHSGDSCMPVWVW